ncbi:hypothetical protein KTE26_07425 [Ralstonia mannitolilytica]|uniref:hypothetical protein n=1 Tax=Ralstonia mannitolilytica TaxID=105219 RepID=UPI00131588C3|nr:hypothetical protein [Ralstonia mannitolilytica]MBU9578269.1 hypothetical protein [Ralstonia mannitolilytica]
MDKFDYLLLLMFLTALLGAILNVAIVFRLREQHAERFEELGRPSAFYFAGVQWMTNFKFFAWVWSRKVKALGDSVLARRILLLRGFWVAFHVAALLFFMALGSR